jgi:hypothetical protein
MHSTEGLHSAPHRRGRIWRIVIVAVLLALIAEPLFMYRMLVAQKEKRQAATALTLPAAVHPRP